MHASNRIDGETYVAYLTSERVERPLFVELFGPLPQTEAEWRAQGASPEEIALTAFGFDTVRRHHVGVNTGFIATHERRVLEETDEYVIAIDRYGRREQLCKAAGSIALPLDYPVATMDDWLRLKPQYTFREDRFAEGWAERARAARDAGALTLCGIPGAFAELRQLMGDERLCLAYYDAPELVHDILATIGDTCERLLERISAEVVIDNLTVHEDLAGKSGPLVGPAQVEEFFRPYYRRCWDLVASRGTRLFSQDSDGNITAVMDAFIDCGVNVFYPMEPAAGMDVVTARRRYGPAIGYKGGIDKHALRHGREAIRTELEYRLQPGMQTGGVVFGLDHRIPNGVPIADYRYYVRTARELLGLDPDPPPGWERMAF